MFKHQTALLPRISNLCFLANLFLVVIPRPAASPLGEAVCGLTEQTNEENSTHGTSSGNKSLSRCLEQFQRGSDLPCHITCATVTLKYPPLVLHLLSPWAGYAKVKLLEHTDHLSLGCWINNKTKKHTGRQKVALEEDAVSYGLSFPPVTMSPSRRVVYMVNTGPV